MQYDTLTPWWRRACVAVGLILLILGVPGLAAEVFWGLHGYPLAWLAAVVALGIVALGALLLLAASRGKISKLDLKMRCQ